MAAGGAAYQRAQMMRAARAKAAYAAHVIAMHRAAKKRTANKPQISQQPQKARNVSYSNSLLQANIESARHLQNSPYNPDAERRIEQIRGPYGWYGNLYTDLTEIGKTKNASSGSSTIIGIFNNSMAELKSMTANLNRVFGTSNYQNALSKYETTTTQLGEEEQALQNLESNYTSELSNANTELSNAKIRNGFVMDNGGGIALSNFLANIGYKPTNYGAKLATKEVELPGVGTTQAGTFLPAGFFNANVGTYVFHPGQFNQIMAQANAANSLFATAQQQASALNNYVNANNAVVNASKLISSLPSWAQPNSNPSSPLYSGSINWKAIGINPAQYSGSSTSSTISIPQGNTATGAGLISAIESGFHILSNPNTYTTIGNDIYTGGQAALSTLSNPATWTAAGKTVISVDKDILSGASTAGNVIKSTLSNPQSYISAGNAVKSAVSTGIQDLKKPSIQKDIIKGVEDTLIPGYLFAQTYGPDLSGYHNYLVTPAGAVELKPNGNYATTPTKAEQEYLNANEDVYENLLPTMVNAQVYAVGNEYNKNPSAMNQIGSFLFNLGAGQGNLIANPVTNAAYGLGSSQFLESVGISAGMVGLEVAPIAFGSGASDLALDVGMDAAEEAIASGAISISTAVGTQYAIKAGIGAAGGALAGTGMDLLNRVPIWSGRGLETIGAMAGLGTLTALTSAPSESALEDAAATIDRISPPEIDSEMSGITSPSLGTDTLGTVSYSGRIPIFNRFGVLTDVGSETGEFDVGLHINAETPAESIARDSSGNPITLAKLNSFLQSPKEVPVETEEPTIFTPDNNLFFDNNAVKFPTENDIEDLEVKPKVTIEESTPKPISSLENGELHYSIGGKFDIFSSKGNFIRSIPIKDVFTGNYNLQSLTFLLKDLNPSQQALITNELIGQEFDRISQGVTDVEQLDLLRQTAANNVAGMNLDDLEISSDKFIANLKSVLSGKELNVNLPQTFFRGEVETDYFSQLNQALRNQLFDIKGGFDIQDNSLIWRNSANAVRGNSESNVFLSKVDLNPDYVEGEYEDEGNLLFKPYDEVQARLDEIAKQNEEHPIGIRKDTSSIPKELRSWLNGKTIDNQITNDEWAHEWDNGPKLISKAYENERAIDNGAGELTKTATKTAEKTYPASASTVAEAERGIFSSYSTDILEQDMAQQFADIGTRSFGSLFGLSESSALLSRGATRTALFYPQSLLQLPKLKSMSKIGLLFQNPTIHTSRLKSMPIYFNPNIPILKNRDITLNIPTTKNAAKTATATKTSTLPPPPTNPKIPILPKLVPGIMFPIRKKKIPAQQLFPIKIRRGKMKNPNEGKGYFAIPDLLNMNIVPNAHAIKINAKTKKVYNQMFRQSLGLNILTQQQLNSLKKRKKKTVITKPKRSLY